jgi:hypothetical protein
MLRNRVGISPDGAMLAAAGAICLATLAALILGSAGLTIVAAGTALVSALISPPVGLLVLTFLGPLKPLNVVPAPGFDLFLVVGILLGCVYRLPIDRPRIAIPGSLLIII